MRKEEIEKAAIGYADAKCQERGCPKDYGFDRLDIERTFGSAAKWRIDSAWHDAKDIVIKPGFVLIEFKGKRQDIFSTLMDIDFKPLARSFSYI